MLYGATSELRGAGTLTSTGVFGWSGGTIGDTCTLEIAAGAQLSGGGVLDTGATLTGAGSASLYLREPRRQLHR